MRPILTLLQMVSQQGEQIQRIDANTEDVVDNVEGAQRELMKYWSRVQGNRWLVAKMFGVLMICTSAHSHLSYSANTRSLPSLGSHFWIVHPRICISSALGKTRHEQSGPATLTAYLSILRLLSYIFFYPYHLQTRPQVVWCLGRFNRLLSAFPLTHSESRTTHWETIVPQTRSATDGLPAAWLHMYNQPSRR
jgi:hypothetical protein